jgi:hypothetical protein
MSHLKFIVTAIAAFLSRVVRFGGLVFQALRSNAEHALDRHYVAEEYHKPWYFLLRRRRRWWRVNLPALWEVANPRVDPFVVTAPSEDWPEVVGHLSEMKVYEGEYYWYYLCVITSHGYIPYPWVRKRK